MKHLMFALGGVFGCGALSAQTKVWQPSPGHTHSEFLKTGALGPVRPGVVRSLVLQEFGDPFDNSIEIHEPDELCV